MQQLDHNKGFKNSMTESKRIRRCPKHKGDSSHSGDRISLLPDDIIVLILSFLTLKEAAVTSLLSRRWRHMWAFTKRLEFVVKDWRRECLRYNLKQPIRFVKGWRRKCLHNNMKRSKRFVKEVNQVLRLHKGSTLEEFRVSYDLNEHFKQEIDNWLKFASAKRVQRLELNFDVPVSVHIAIGRIVREEYKLSYGVVNQTDGTSSKTMSSSLCRTKCCKFADFESLKELCLKCVNVTGEILEGLLSCCPSLEKLTVVESKGLERLKVQGPSLVLKCLEIKLCLNLSVVEICNVNLVTLVYVGHKISWVLHNAPALVNLTIGGSTCQPLSNLWLTQLSRCLSQLETLTIEYRHAEVVEVGDVPLELSNLRKLVLNLLIRGDHSLLGYMPLMKASPNLQRFVLESWRFQPTIVRREIRGVEKLPLQHIEEMEFRGFCGNTSQLELLMFFLENAVSLKKIIVDPNEACSNTYTEMMQPPATDKRMVEAARRRAMRQLEGLMLQGFEIKVQGNLVQLLKSE